MVIFGCILEELFVTGESRGLDRERTRSALVFRLKIWLENLDSDLQLHCQRDEAAPRPYVLMLHLWFWSVVALVDRDLCVFNYYFFVTLDI